MINGINGIGAIDTQSLATFAEAMKPKISNNLLPVDMTTGDIIQLARTDSQHYTANGQLDDLGVEEVPTFQDALLKAMNGVNADQNKSDSLIQQMIIDPDSVDAHDVTISMAQASMSLSIARTVLDRVVRGWKDLINTR
jgi:flagellar hook-basal body complex protein FliE